MTGSLRRQRLRAVASEGSPLPERDSLSRSIIGLAAVMSLVTLAGLPLFGSIVAFGETSPLAQLPWVLPVAQSFAILSALAIAFLCLGRYAALGGSWAYWSGAVFISSSILSGFYLLSWPGLLGDRGLIARLSNTASWFFFMTFSTLALLAIIAAAGQDRRPKPMAHAYRLYATSAFLAVVVGALSLAFEDSLPQLVAGLAFSPLNVAWVGALWAIMGVGAVAAYRRYRKEQDVFLGYLALFLILMAFGILYSALGGKRYDLWWYASRVVYPLGFMTMLFGLLQEGYSLFSRERARVEERTQLLREIEQLAGVAQQRANDLETVLESITDAVIVCDREERIVLANSAAAALLGKTMLDAQETISTYAGTLQLKSVNHTPLGVENMAISRALHSGELVEGQEEVATHPTTGKRIVKHVSAAPLRDREGHIFGAVQVAGDITRLRELQERQEEYVSLIGHDLRSPLTSILGRAQLLERSLARAQMEKDAEMATGIVASARRIDAMTRDLVESARLEQGQLEMRIERVDIVTLLQGLVDTIGSPADRPRVRLQLPQGGLTVVGDPDRLERVLTNLITNALKYSSSELPVDVRVEAADGQVVVSVRDQGVGIPPEDLPRIFERDFRSKTAGQRDGLGLGLYIAHLITRAHGGTIAAESQVGRGSTFRLTLPRETPRQEPGVDGDG